MKVALVHDDLVQWGGAERVLLALSELFPAAPIFTSVCDFNNLLIRQNFINKNIITSFIQAFPGWKSNYRVLLPFYPIAFEQFDFSGFDLVISQTTRFAKSIITKPETKHICYCHTPPRFLWNFSGEQTSVLLKPYFNWLKNYDLIVSKRVDFWIAGSINAQKRIKKVYQVNSEVVYPFVDLESFANIEPFDGGYWLVISRLNKYKKVDLVIKTANKLNKVLKIVGVGPEEENLQQIAGKTIEFLGLIEEELLLQLIAGCEVLVIAGEEDFGLTALEAQALGKPVIALKKGGVLESVVDGQTGYFFTESDVKGLSMAVDELDRRSYNKRKCFEQAEKFSKSRFIHQFTRVIDSIT